MLQWKTPKKQTAMAYGDKCSPEFEHLKSAAACKQNTKLRLVASSRFQVFISSASVKQQQFISILFKSPGKKLIKPSF